MNYIKIKFTPENPGSGFFSNYLGVISTIIVATRNYQNLIPYIDVSNTWFNPTFDFDTSVCEDPTINPWDWWFENPKLNPSDILHEMSIDYGPISHVPTNFKNNINLDLGRKLASQFCPIHTNILEEIQTLYEKHFLGKTTLGIMARGTEMLQFHLNYPKVKSNTWATIISEYLQKYPNIDNIFVVTDDNEILENILEFYPDIVYFKDFFRKTTQPDHLIGQYRHKPWWLTPLDGDILTHRKKLGKECIIQSTLLSKCPHVIGAHSGVTNGAYFFNNTPFTQFTVI